MGKSIALLVLVFAAVMILQGLTRAAKPSPRGLKPVARRFMTPRELAMLDILERCLPQYRFHAQVSMGALLNAAPNPLRRRMPSDRNAFAQKIVDFVAQDRSTGAIVALIEVDDATHNAERDCARDEMTRGAGYQTVRIGRAVPARFQEVRAVVLPLLSPMQPANQSNAA